MKTKHTPGPWKVVGGNVIVTLAYTAPNLASVEVKGVETSELVRANAHLIAAAPEMFDALILWEMQLEADLSGGMRVIQPGEQGALEAMLKVCRSAISKARGLTSNFKTVME